MRSCRPSVRPSVPRRRRRGGEIAVGRMRREARRGRGGAAVAAWALAWTLAACFAVARRSAATGVVGAREPHDPSPRPSDRGVALVDPLSAHALAADAADAAAEALLLPRSTGTRFDAESLSSSVDSRVAARHARPRGDAFGDRAPPEAVDTRWTVASAGADAHAGTEPD